MPLIHKRIFVDPKGEVVVISRERLLERQGAARYWRMEIAYNMLYKNIDFGLLEQ